MMASAFNSQSQEAALHLCDIHGIVPRKIRDALPAQSGLNGWGLCFVEGLKPWAGIAGASLTLVFVLIVLAGDTVAFMACAAFVTVLLATQEEEVPRNGIEIPGLLPTIAGTSGMEDVIKGVPKLYVSF